LAAIFAGGFFVVIASIVSVMIFGDEASHSFSVDWGILIALSFLKLVYQIRGDLSNPKGFAHLSKFEK
jgi:hypothetical protein